MSISTTVRRLPVLGIGTLRLGFGPNSRSFGWRSAHDATESPEWHVIALTLFSEGSPEVQRREAREGPYNLISGTVSRLPFRRSVIRDLGVQLLGVSLTRIDTLASWQGACSINVPTSIRWIENNKNWQVLDGVRSIKVRWCPTMPGVERDHRNMWTAPGAQSSLHSPR